MFALIKDPDLATGTVVHYFQLAESLELVIKGMSTAHYAVTHWASADFIFTLNLHFDKVFCISTDNRSGQMHFLS